MSTSATRCYKHPIHLHMASCSDCHAWHMPRALARRDALLATEAAQAIAMASPLTPASQDVDDPTPVPLVVPATPTVLTLVSDRTQVAAAA